MKFSLIEGPLVDQSHKRGFHYGVQRSHEDLVGELMESALEYDVEIECFSNYVEGEIIRYIAGLEGADGIMINPGAYTHTSVGIRDALLMRGLPFVEFHFSNIFGREEFRRHSYISDVASGVIVGLGEYAYISAFFALLNLLKSQ